MKTANEERSNLSAKDKSATRWIAFVSVVLPITVALLFVIPKSGNAGETIQQIPHLNAVLNSLTIVALLAGLWAIKTGRKILHRYLMISAITLSALFLVGYVIYHSQTPSTEFGGEGFTRIFYFSVLISHIILAAIVAPLILVTFVRALKGKFDKHKKLARIAYPVWLYVAISGVAVYLMISPYY